MKKIKNLFWKAVFGIGFRNRKKAASLIGKILIKYTMKLDSAESLKFLFDLEDTIYLLQGEKSIIYGNGTHSKHNHTGYHEYFINHIKKTDTVLDVGCGFGEVAYDVAKNTGAKVTGIDIDPEKIRIANQKKSMQNVDFICGDIWHANIDKKYNVIILSNVLEHLKDRINFLKMIKSTGGVKLVLLRVPMFERDWRVPLRKELGCEWRLDKTHETEYTREQLEAEMKGAGLKINALEIKWGEFWVVLEIV